jgi:hypothetical protein
MATLRVNDKPSLKAQEWLAKIDVGQGREVALYVDAGTMYIGYPRSFRRPSRSWFGWPADSDWCDESWAKLIIANTPWPLSAVPPVAEAVRQLRTYAAVMGWTYESK